MHREKILLALVAFTLLVLGAIVWWSAQRDAQRELVYVIPPGTSARLRAGEQVNVFPTTIRLALDTRDRLVIRNDDTEPVTIGLFPFQPGQEYRQRFTRTGSFKLTCSTHSAGELLILVEQKSTPP